MKRQIKQIVPAVIQSTGLTVGQCVLYALCDDGSVWLSRSDDDWVKLKPIPQDPEPDEPSPIPETPGPISENIERVRDK